MNQLDAMGVLDFLKSKAQRAKEFLRESIRERRLGEKVEPLYEQGKFVHVLFTLDFSETKTRMLQRFEAWLDLKENKERLDTHRCENRGKADEFKDHLKDLATCRLYDDLPADGSKSFGSKSFDRLIEFTNHRRLKFDKPTKLYGVQYQTGDGRPFHDARAGQTEKVALNKAELYNEKAACDKAIERVSVFRAEIIHWEFGEGNIANQIAAVAGQISQKSKEAKEKGLPPS